MTCDYVLGLGSVRTASEGGVRREYSTRCLGYEVNVLIGLGEMLPER